MYKLILGNVRITVSDDTIPQGQAAAAARKAINEATQHGKLLSYIEIRNTDLGLDVLTTEKDGCRSARKTLRQSMLDAMVATVKEKLYSVNAYSNKDDWFDSDTGQEWCGNSVSDTKDELLKEFEKWASSTK